MTVSTPVREVLGDDLSAYVLPVPVQCLRDTEQYLAVLDGFEQEFTPGTRFSYCDGGFVVSKGAWPPARFLDA